MRRHLLVSALLCALSLVASAQTQTLGLNAPRLFDKGMDALTGVGISQNDLDAIEYFRRSADLGYAPAQVVMGYFSETGFHIPQNPSAAADWYKKAAKQDDRLGDWLLGRSYFTGNGAARDLAGAETWLQKAANQGDPFGQYLQGLIKLERNDYSKAADLFRRSAMQGLPQAQEQLGKLLKDGRGVTADKTEAYVWLLLSFQSGNQAAASAVQELEAELGSNQVAAAKSQARDLQATTTRAAVAKGCTGWPGEFDPVPTPPPPDIQRFCR